VVNGNSEVFVMDADGGHALNLSDSPAYDGWPAWSPDGKRIVYAGGEPGKEVLLYLVNPDGTGRVTLTDKAGTEDRHPAFSPDGTMLVFTRYRAGTMESSDLCVLRLPGAKG
jgi:TolB protein